MHIKHAGARFSYHLIYVLHQLGLRKVGPSFFCEHASASHSLISASLMTLWGTRPPLQSFILSAVQCLFSLIKCAGNEQSFTNAMRAWNCRCLAYVGFRMSCMPWHHKFHKHAALHSTSCNKIRTFCRLPHELHRVFVRILHCFFH